MHRTVALVAVFLAITGCAAPINVRNAEAHARAGYGAISRGDWDTARRQFAQAVVNADLGNAELSGKWQVNYQYGRALGVTCFWEEAEKYLLRSMQFSEQIDRAPRLSLYELGLLSQKQGKSAQAVSYFAQLIPLMEKEGLRATYPLGVADAYERYAASLEATGQTESAARNRIEARSIRNANPTATPFGTVTPYGSTCAQAS